MQTYSLGDTIRVELDLRDESGVLTVSATFYETESGHDFSMHGEGEGRPEVTVMLTEEVTDKTLPGEYRCKDVTVYDTHHNLMVRPTMQEKKRRRYERLPDEDLSGYRCL